MNKMINKTIKVAFVIVLTMIGNTYTFAQSIDEERMNRDLKVAENILATLSEEDGRRLWGHDNVESSYIPDYGVIFTMPMKSAFFFGGQNAVISSGGNDVYVIESNDEDDDYDIRVKADNRIKIVDADSKQAKEIKENSNMELKNQISTFLADYADLIGQLKPSDRIVVQMKNKNEFEFYTGRSKSKSNPSLTAEVLKSNLTAQRQGKISRDELIDRIEFKGGEEKEVAKDVELFATIFARLYEPDLSSTYYLSSRNIGYNRLENLGVTFSMKFYSSSSDNGLHTIRTTGERGLTQEERNEIVNAMYPEFVASFKQNLLDYGRTVKSLEGEEKLIFKVRLTECKDCDMPREIEVMVSAKTLSDYDKGSISKDKAMGMVEVKRKEN